MRTVAPAKPQSFRINAINEVRVDETCATYDAYDPSVYYEYDTYEYAGNADSGETPESELEPVAIQNFHIGTSNKNPEIIHLNCGLKYPLPYIEVPEIQSKFIIDTGSARSFISPAKASEYFDNYKQCEPFEVISTHASSQHGEVIEVPLFPTFKIGDESHKFYVYDVDECYDGLIGVDLLKQIDAKIDMKNNIFIQEIDHHPYDL